MAKDFPTLKGKKRWYAIVHSAISKMPRSYIISDDGPINLDHHIGLGEDGFHIDAKDRIMNEDGTICPQCMRKMVARKHGIDHTTIPDDRCVLVHRETQLVENVVHADPEIDTILHPTHHVVANCGEDTGVIGDKHDGTKFLRKHHVVINGILHGHVWDSQLPEELEGIAHRDHRNEWVDKKIGDAIELPDLKDAPTKDTQVL